VLSFALALLLAQLDLRLAAAPLFLFVCSCVAAPFFPRWCWFLPVLNRGPRGSKAVALTFDDGPDPVATPALLELLARHRAKAAFFVVGDRVRRHPELVKRLLQEGHEVANHSLSHDPLLMLRRRTTIEREIDDCSRLLESLGAHPLAFRPPVGITNPKLGVALAERGLSCVCFSNRPVDFANRRLEGLADRVLEKARGGDIILLHDWLPDPAAKDAWLAEVEAVLNGLAKKGLAVRPLAELLGRPVMRPQTDDAWRHAPAAAPTA
jgi:peptidoglycan/xylan/chitin deacetylase (PgdA/CDA1 family)